MNTASREFRRGFTLIEIMIVVGIIGLLAAMAVPAFIRARARSAQAGCINNLRQIDSAKSQWAIERKAAPTASPTDAELFGVGLYLKKKPDCPAGGNYLVDAINTPPSCNQPGHALN